MNPGEWAWSKEHRTVCCVVEAVEDWGQRVCRIWLPDKDAVEKNAQGPQRARGDVGEVRQHSLRAQIEADRYLAFREARSKPHKALRFAKLLPPGGA